MDPQERQEGLVRMFGAVNAFSEDDGLFFIAPDRLGFGIMADPLSGIDAQTVDALNGLLNLAYPTGTIVQFALYASPDIEDTIYRFSAMRRHVETPLLKEITAKRIEFMRKLTREPIGRASGAKLRQMRLVITCSIKHGPNPPERKDLQEYRELRMTFEAAAKAAGLRPEPLTPEKYIRFMETVLNHGPNAMWKGVPWGHHDGGTLICNQLLDNDSPIDVDKHQLSLGEDAKVRTLSVKRYPEVLYPGMAMRYMADLMKGTKAVRDPMLVTVNILYPDHESKRGDLTRDFAWNQKQSEGQLARMIPDWARRTASLKVTLDRVNEGDRIIQAYIGAAVFGENDDRVIQASMDAQSTFRELGFQMMEDRYFVAPLFSQLLPFAAEDAIKAAAMRYRTMATYHAVPMLPVLGAWAGTPTPMLTLFGRDGNLMRFSPYDTDGNMNGIIAAQSGMGKSFLANELTTNFLSIGGRTWIIDKGFSYKKLADVMGGTYIEFREDLDICLNPFGLVRSFEEEGDILNSIFEVMATPKEGLNSFQSAGLKKVVQEVWVDKQNDACVDDIADRLLAHDDQRIRDVGAQMYAFTSKGVYGRWFNGRNNCDLGANLVVLELQQLSGRKDLQRVVLLQLMYQIQLAMDSLPRDMPKLLLIDEAFGLLASNETKDFIITWYRQLRKFGASAFVATQSINDLYESAGAEAIVENSAHMLLLGQKAESIAMVKQKQRLPMAEGAFKLLESVHTVPGEYSEILVRNAWGIGVGRLVVSDFNKLLYSSKAQDVMAIKAWQDRGCTLPEAINRVLQERSGKREDSDAGQPADSGQKVA